MTSPLSGTPRDSLTTYIERTVAILITGLLLWVGAAVSELKTDVAQIQVHVEYLRQAVTDIEGAPAR